MILIAPIPFGWFNDELSLKASDMLDVRPTYAWEWVPLMQLYCIDLPKQFKLQRYLDNDRLHAIVFTFENQNEEVIIHPDKLLNISKLQLRRKYGSLIN